MAKINFTFVDEQGADLNKFIVTREDGTSYNIHLSRGATITTPGTPLNAKNMNQLVSAINEIYLSRVTGVKGSNENDYRTGNVNITKANIGLSNVDDTPDSEKDVNSAAFLRNEDKGELYNVGSAGQPVYFSNGKPIACYSGFSKIVNSVGYYSSDIRVVSELNKEYFFKTVFLGLLNDRYPKPYLLIFEVENNRGEINTGICSFSAFQISDVNKPIAFSFSTADTKRTLLLHYNKNSVNSGDGVWNFIVDEMSGISRITSIKQIYLPYMG